MLDLKKKKGDSSLGIFHLLDNMFVDVSVRL